jgi:hypothetical protein
MAVGGVRSSVHDLLLRVAKKAMLPTMMKAIMAR